MSLALFLPWFPIVLAVGLGGRLLGRGRGYALGVLCAWFWLALAHASTGGAMWSQGGSIIALAAGAAAIITMGGWAGQTGLAEVTSAGGNPRAPSVTGTESVPTSAAGIFTDDLSRLAETLDRFSEWIVEHEHTEDLWPAFDGFIRAALRTCCGATHVRPYYLTSDGAFLEPLRTEAGAVDRRRVPATEGLPGAVLASRSAYVVGDEATVPTPGPEGSVPGGTAWCFPVYDGGRALGVVVVGHVPVTPLRQRAMLRVAERLVSQCWRTLAETLRRRLASESDPISAVQTREAFLERGGRDLAESHALGEPAALAVVALEGLRELNDHGQWEAADEVVRNVGSILRGKVRADDRVGRFDGSRFLVLLRRVDADLTRLIVGQLIERLTALSRDEVPAGARVVARCGVALTGAGPPDLRAMLTRSLRQCRRAREERRIVAGEFEPESAMAQGASP